MRNLKNLLSLREYTRTKCMCPVPEEFKKSTCPAGVYKKKCICPVHEEFKKSTCPASIYKKKMYVPRSWGIQNFYLPCGHIQEQNVCAQFMRNLKNILALRAYTRKNVCAQFMRNLKNLLALRAYARKKCMYPDHEEFKTFTCPAGIYKNKMYVPSSWGI